MGILPKVRISFWYNEDISAILIFPTKNIYEGIEKLVNSSPLQGEDCGCKFHCPYHTIWKVNLQGANSILKIEGSVKGMDFDYTCFPPLF